jgi:hypothetical protein
MDLSGLSLLSGAIKDVIKALWLNFESRKFTRIIETEEIQYYSLIHTDLI